MYRRRGRRLYNFIDVRCTVDRVDDARLGHRPRRLTAGQTWSLQMTTLTARYDSYSASIDVALTAAAT